MGHVPSSGQYLPKTAVKRPQALGTYLTLSLSPLQTQLPFFPPSPSIKSAPISFIFIFIPNSITFIIEAWTH